jgi:SAM-dependent methyltransferase
LSQSYEEQVRQQIEQYRDTENMHDLPAVFHVWSSDYILPGLKQVFGADDINAFYVLAFEEAASHGSHAPVFLSLGCGDGGVEIGIARTLLQRGMRAFRFICYDLSDILLGRFRAALPPELESYFELVAGDLNAHVFETKFDAVMANHTLHHIVDLEGVYRTTFDCLTDHGIFVTSDMIGRNGHMRWPEARLFVDFFWPFLTQRQRRNVLLRRQEAAFVDHDCSGEGFEGVRAEEVLPLILRQGFHPWKFLGFGGMVDVFVDRCFGPGFDVKNPDDVFLARRIGFLNEILLDAGLVKPTMMLAYFTKADRNDSMQYRNRSAVMSVRATEAPPAWLAGALTDFARAPVSPDYVFRDRQTEIAALLPVPTPPLGPVPAVDHSPQLLEALRSAQEQQAAAQAQVASLTERVRAMEQSSSWELTAPLRLLLRKFRRSA